MTYNEKVSILFNDVGIIDNSANAAWDEAVSLPVTKRFIRPSGYLHIGEKHEGLWSVWYTTGKYSHNKSIPLVGTSISKVNGSFAKGSLMIRGMIKGNEEGSWFIAQDPVVSENINTTLKMLIDKTYKLHVPS